MKILVCISHVPDTSSKINFSEGDTKFDSNGVQYVINPNDEFGLTRAMWFKEKQNASIDVISVGGSETETTLRKALAIGADAAIRVNASTPDGLAVAKHLADVAKKGSLFAIPGAIIGTIIGFLLIEIISDIAIKIMALSIVTWIFYKAIIRMLNREDITGQAIGEMNEKF